MTPGKFWNLFARLCVAACLFLVACSDPPEKDRCATQVCDRGVCNPDNGACENPDACDAANLCLAGFECAAGGCIATFPCEDDGACDGGICERGACVNPPACAASEDCLPGWSCNAQGTCVDDPCLDVTCDRGVCDQDSGECVNSEVCTEENEEEKCLDGFHCWRGSCQTPDAICEDVQCPRGVCDAGTAECVDADDCQGSDMNCLAGSFCNAQNQCQVNTCDDQMIMCNRGVCDPTDGSCVNAESCSNGAQCVDGYYCIAGSCLEQDAACQDCVGNQTCAYDGTSSVSCEENANGCANAVDCLGDRICEDGSCQDPGNCTDDDLEPNEDTAGATDYIDAPKINGAVDAGICGSDTDVYLFDPERDPQFTGKLVVNLAFDSEDVGRGELLVEILDEAGTVVQDSTSSNGSTRVSHTIGVVDQTKDFYVRVSPSGTISSAGIDYRLFADLVDNAVVLACNNATQVNGTVSGNTSSGVSTALGSSCVTDAAAPEEIFTFDVTEPSFVSATVTPTSGANLTVGLRTQCEIDATEFACVDNQSAGGAETVSAELQPGTYYAVVQGPGPGNAGSFDLQVATDPIICDASDNACVSQNEARYCNDRGTGFVTETCDMGCDSATGLCDRVDGDVCYNAIDASNGFDGTITWSRYTADYDPGMNSCVPNASSFSGTETDGGDVVYRVDLGANEAVQADLTASDFSIDGMSLYAVTNCSDISGSCVEGANAGEWDTDEQLIYTNTSTQPKTLFIVADSASPSAGTAEMHIETGAVICTPGETSCSGGDLQTCNDAGIALDTTTCSFGCDAATGSCNPPPNDLCDMGAVDVTAGGTFSATIEDYANDYDPSGTGCTGFSADGPDAIYVVNGNVGDVVTADLDPPYDASLYAVTDCGDISGTCLAGSDLAGSVPESITFAIQDPGPVYIVADSFSSNPSGQFDLTVDVRTPDCNNPGEAIVCKDSSTLQYCNDLGFTTDYTCGGSCSQSACGNPTGDYCFDSIPLTPGGSFSGSWSDYANNHDPGIGTCVYGPNDRLVGPDTVFEMQLFPGDIVTAELTTSASGASLYMLENCSANSDTCLLASANSDTLEFYAANQGTYYLVVDSTSSSPSGTFTLDTSLTQGGQCQPGRTSCVSASSELYACSDDGTTVEEIISCDHGCDGEYCLPPTTLNDTCADAATITGSTLIYDSYGKYTNNYDPGTGSCVDVNATGHDSVYKVDLAADEVVMATVTGFESFVDPNVYFVSDCTDVTSNCLDGAKAPASGGPTVTGGYLATQAETVYVIVDADSTYRGPFVVDLEIKQSECTPPTEQCVDSTTREFCTSYGVFVPESCYFGCTNGQCDPAPNDTCMGAIDATAGGTFKGPAEEFADDYDPGSSGCTGYAASGPDAAYTVNPQQGDIITATLSASYDTALYAVTDCSDLTTCLAGHDSLSGAETIQFVAPSTAPVFIIADAFSSSPTGEYSLDVTVETPICTPGTAMCAADGVTLEYCNALGTAWESYTCDSSGCPSGGTSCANPTGEVCPDAIDATAGGSFSGQYSDYVDDYDPGGSGCTGFTAAGSDVAYRVDLLSGETVTADLTSQEDTALYIVKNCADLTTCVDGDDQFGAGGESVSHTASQDETVWVIVDAYDDTASGMYTVDITVN